MAGINVSVTDNHGNVIGSIGRTNFSGACIDTSSLLPYQTVSCPNFDGLIQFKYSADTWTMTDGSCNVGGYEGSERQMDCGFAC